MKTNLKTLKLIKKQSESIRIALTYQDQPEPHESFWIIGKDEIDYTIRRLRGQEKTSYLIDDLSYHLKFGTDGILCFDMSNNKLVRHYVTFPGYILADALETVNSWTYQEDYKRDMENILIVSQDTIDRAAFQERNKSKIIYHDGVDYSVKEIVIRLLRDPLTKDYFKSHLKSFIRQAGEIKGTFDLYLDSDSQKDDPYPSFYFVLLNKDGQRYYNGGIINHSETEIPDYSIHT